MIPPSSLDYIWYGTPAMYLRRATALGISIFVSGLMHAQIPADSSTDLHEIWEPPVTVVQAPPNQAPSDAILLFDGTSTHSWLNIKPDAPSWQIVDGALIPVKGASSIRTKQAFGDIQLHLEFRTPAEVVGTGQGRGNSGVIFMGRYELQILDSYRNATYINGQAGSIYKQHIPLVNASRLPGEWQSFDVIFVAPRFHPDGKLRLPGRVTVFHNGVLVQHDVVIRGTTKHKGLPSYTAHAEKEPLTLQYHNNSVGFRNVWVRELNLPEQLPHN